MKLLRKNPVTHATELAADAALGLAVGLNVLPKATHASSYSYRARREVNTAALNELIRCLRPLGLATGDAGFNLDFHAIRHHGTEAPLDNNYVPNAPRPPGPCWPCSPKTTPRPRWSTPTPI
jgi:hypothetical protein